MVRYYYAVVMVFVLVIWGGGARAQEGAAGDNGGLVRVETPRGFDRYGETVKGHAMAAFRDLNQRTGDALLVPVTFVVAETAARFDELSGGASEHALAVAFGREQRVIINYELMAQSGADRIRQVLVHELAHVYLDVKCKALVPHWVHEGVAQHVAGEWSDAPGDGQMALAAYTGGLIPLRDLMRGFPTDRTRRNQAYAEAYSALGFLVREDYGNSLSSFLGAIRGDGGVERLKELGGGVTLDAFDLRWRNELKSPMFLVGVVASSGFFWGVAAVLVVAGFVVKRRRSKLIRGQWAREEAMAAEFESIHDRIDRFDEELEAELYESGEPPAGFEPEETPYDRYLAEKERERE